MSNNQQQQQNQQPQGTSNVPQQGKMMNQVEYAKYKQEDSNSNNYYEFSKEATVLPVAWDGKFVTNPNDVRIKPDRNRSSSSSFYEFDTNPTVLPPCWDGTFAKSGETRLLPERNRSNDQKYFWKKKLLTIFAEVDLYYQKLQNVRFANFLFQKCLNVQRKKKHLRY